MEWWWLVWRGRVEHCGRRRRSDVDGRCAHDAKTTSLRRSEGPEGGERRRHLLAAPLALSEIPRRGDWRGVCRALALAAGVASHLKKAFLLPQSLDSIRAAATTLQASSTLTLNLSTSLTSNRTLGNWAAATAGCTRPFEALGALWRALLDPTDG